MTDQNLNQPPDNPAPGYLPAPPDNPAPGYAPPPANLAQAPGNQATPPPGYAYGYQNTAPTNTMAILALIAGIVLPPLGIVFGHIALKQIRNTGEQGNGMAKVGLILGYVFTVIWLFIIIAVVMSALAAASLIGVVGSTIPQY